MDEKGFAPFAAVGNVANRARVTIDEARTALTILESPDTESSDPENEGRRLERVPGGWLVLNAEKHRDLVTRAIRQAQTAERVRRHRALKRASNAPVTQSEAYSEAVTEEKTDASPVIENKPDREISAPVKANGNGARPHLGGPIIGRNTHLDHAACDDLFSYCVPSAVHRKFADLLAPKHAGDRDQAKAALQAWYPTVWATIPTGTVMGDAFRFWQTHFDTAFATVEPKRFGVTSKTVGNAAALKRFAERKNS